MRLDSTLQEEIKQIEDLMISSKKTVIPDVRIAVEGTLMLRWNKEAKPIFDRSGKQLIWTPDIKTPNKKDKNDPLHDLFKKEPDEVEAAKPADCRVVWNHGGKTAFGFQPLTSIYDP